MVIESAARARVRAPSAEGTEMLDTQHTGNSHQSGSRSTGRVDGAAQRCPDGDHGRPGTSALPGPTLGLSEVQRAAAEPPFLAGY